MAETLGSHWCVRLGNPPLESAAMFAQGIAGVVKDSSGAALPGMTVERRVRP